MTVCHCQRVSAGDQESIELLNEVLTGELVAIHV